MMKLRIAILFLLLCGNQTYAAGQEHMKDTLEFAYFLHGQTRRYQVVFENSNDTLYLRWGIERNTKWQSGSFAVTPAARKNATGLSFLQPVDGQHVVLPDDETTGILSQSAFRQLKETGKFTYNKTTYGKTGIDGNLIQAYDPVEGCRMWIVDDMEFPLIWRVRNNPLGINWEVRRLSKNPLPVRDEVFRDIRKSGSTYYAYPSPESKQTPPPAGFTPFYISHYGRHGSRWITTEERYTKVLKVFEDHALTPLGEDVKKRLYEVWEDAKGRAGELTPVGERQQREIAGRLFRNYPAVFDGKAEVSARSTIASRCVMSMAAFTVRLKELNPALDVKRESDQRYMDYLAYDSPELKEFYASDTAWRADFRKFEEEHIRPDRIIGSLFAEPEKIGKSGELMMGLYWIASSMQNTSLSLSFYDIFRPEELFGIWQCINYRMYVCNAACPLNKGIPRNSARTLLQNIIESADYAIGSGTTAATLRFGHDTNLIRLLTLMQAEGCRAQESDPYNYYLAWQDFKVSPMAANLQIVFFRNGKNDVLVKFLHNENEVRLPVASAHEPYYLWGDVKKFFSSL